MLNKERLKQIASDLDIDITFDSTIPGIASAVRTEENYTRFEDLLGFFEKKQSDFSEYEFSLKTVDQSKTSTNTKFSDPEQLDMFDFKVQSATSKSASQSTNERTYFFKEFKMSASQSEQVKNVTETMAVKERIRLEKPLKEKNSFALAS